MFSVANRPWRTVSAAPSVLVNVERRRLTIKSEAAQRKIFRKDLRRDEGSDVLDAAVGEFCEILFVDGRV
jgi:hypothetical protein